MGMHATRSGAWIRRSLAGLLVLAMVLGALPTGGRDLGPRRAEADDQIIHETFREFFRTGRYILYIGGTLQDDARIYQSRRAGAFLVLGSSHGKALLIQPREKVVSDVPVAEIAQRPDKGVDLVRDAKINKLGEVRIDSGGIAVNVEELRARLQPQPHLLGRKSAEEVLLHSPEYERAGASYSADASDIAKIKGNQRDIEVIIFFGTWCPTCKRLLPRILKVDEAIQGAKLKITYYGLKKKGSPGPPDANLDRYGIKHIPTGVVLLDGKHRGNISGRQFSRPERALAALIR